MNIDIDKFKDWLILHGCEILPPTNEYEAVRWKGSEVGVLYTSSKTNNTYSFLAIQAFRHKAKWNGGPIKTGRRLGYKKQKEQLIKRDGTTCFYCGKELEDDITVEHVLSLSSGGKNTLGNMVLAHFSCNQAVSNLSIVEKVNYALMNRK